MQDGICNPILLSLFLPSTCGALDGKRQGLSFALRDDITHQFAPAQAFLQQGQTK